MEEEEEERLVQPGGEEEASEPESNHVESCQIMDCWVTETEIESLLL